MNERIKEIAKKAGGHNNVSEFCGYYLLPSSDYIDPATVDLEKFAELLIQECISVASAQRNPQSLNYKPSERFVADLKQHFGIKD